MISDEERREAAEMLREQAEEGYGVTLESMAYALGLDSDDGECGDEDAFNLLADLIDPTCHIAPDDLASQQCMGPMLSCDRCGAAFPSINEDYN